MIFEEDGHPFPDRIVEALEEELEDPEIEELYDRIDRHLDRYEEILGGELEESYDTSERRELAMRELEMCYRNLVRAELSDERRDKGYGEEVLSGSRS